MFALTLGDITFWAVDTVVALVVIRLIVKGLRSSVTRWGGRLTLLGVLAIAVAIASAVVFPLHRGDGRTTSYNDGWDGVASLPASQYYHLDGSMSCVALYRESAAVSSDFHRIEVKGEWVHGCRDGRVALWRAHQNATIATKYPRG
ncbi:MAG TPA: hypothetical protein VMU98_08985 [Acidimicrobiales bacterium]|nr:hypothetical protein [Acidimicrobiales bacterium]